MDPLVSAVGGLVATALLGTLAYLMRGRVERQEHDVEKESTHRAAEVEKIRKELADSTEKERLKAELDREKIRSEIAIVAANLAKHELHVAKECINGDQLAAMLRPILDRLTDFRADMKEIYLRLERKVDKPGMGD